MSQQALAVSPASATKWTVISGPMAGSVRLMEAPQFTVGRSPDCEFVIISDPKCSRKHAQIISTGYGCEVISLNDKNPVLVNDKGVERGTLEDGDVITFGDTRVQYNLTGVSGNESKLTLVAPAELQYAQPAASPAGPATARPRARSGGQSGKAPGNRLVFYAIVGGVLYWLLSPSSPKKAPVSIRTEQQIQADIDTANKLREASEIQSMKRMDRSVVARQAQENYVRGFREYRRGHYDRAMSSLQACLALNPSHVLCNRYLRLAQRKFDELVQYQVVMGRKALDQGQYSSCRAFFRNVMVMVKRANSPIFQEAKATYDTCNNLLEGRY